MTDIGINAELQSLIGFKSLILNLNYPFCFFRGIVFPIMKVTINKDCLMG